MNTARGTFSPALVSEKKALNGPSLTQIRLFDRVCRLAGCHARVSAALNNCSHTGDPHGGHGSIPSPAFLNNEVAVTNSIQFDEIANGRRLSQSRVSSGKIGDNGIGGKTRP
jgi:hypothetical protein